MFEHYDLATLAVGILGFSFLLLWRADQLNIAGLLWGVGHLPLSLAIASGYRYQTSGADWLGAVSLMSVSIFLVALHSANRFLIGRRISVNVMFGQVAIVTVVIGITGFVGHERAGNLVVAFAMTAIYFWSALIFVRIRKQYVIGLVFAINSLVVIIPWILESTVATTANQSIETVSLSLSVNVLLGLVLVYVAAQQSRRRLGAVLSNLPDAVFARRLDGTLLFCNEEFARLAGAQSPAQLVGRPIPLLAEDDQEAIKVSHEINRIASSGPMTAPLVMERSVRPAKGPIFPAEVTVSTFIDFGQQVVLGQIRDLTERKKAEDERLRHVTIDELTDLPNRNLLEQQLTSVLWECQRNRTQCAVLLIDLDHFKKVNETMGHIRGNEVLVETAKILTALCRPRDLLGRLGGDEFVLVLTDLIPGAETLFVEDHARSLHSLLSREIRQGDLHVLLGASIGITFSSADGVSSASLFQQAEIAMYEAKAHGRGGLCFFDKNMNQRLADSLRLESQLRNALKNDKELHLVYQPIVDAKTGRICKAEALIRWASPILGQVPPIHFIPIAEQSGLIIELGAYVMESAIKQISHWKQQEKIAPIVSINVSARQFAHADFEKLLLSKLKHYGVEPQEVELELTESLLVDDGPELPQLMRRLQEEGISLSLDDFGTGYSSLSYLSRFNLNTVKIDRSFVSGIEESHRSRSLTKAIISMGHSLGLKVVAEGVETVEQRDFLALEGCDFLQGYFFSKPVAAEQLDLDKL